MKKQSNKLFVGFLLIFAYLLNDCQSAAVCVNRDTIVARGQKWVDKNVPYNQNKTYDGYRTDCSGFVSMCWGVAKPGVSTQGFGSVSTRITKQNLQKGDALVSPGTHIVLFVNWQDPAKKTSYVGMDEAGTSKGTVKRIIPYPFFDNKASYYPIRYNLACP